MIKGVRTGVIEIDGTEYSLQTWELETEAFVDGSDTGKWRLVAQISEPTEIEKGQHVKVSLPGAGRELRGSGSVISRPLELDWSGEYIIQGTRVLPAIAEKPLPSYYEYKHENELRHGAPPETASATLLYQVEEIAELESENRELRERLEKIQTAMEYSYDR